MTLLDAHGHPIQQPDIHDPRGVSAEDALLLARMVEEIRELDASEQSMVIALSALTAVQLAGLVQLALRHAGTAGDIRATGLHFLENVREFFADAPAVLEIIRRGDDPAWDVRDPDAAFTPAMLTQMRADVANGSGHECEEWWNTRGVCALCDRKRP